MIKSAAIENDFRSAKSLFRLLLTLLGGVNLLAAVVRLPGKNETSRQIFLDNPCECLNNLLR